jgi:hypothetical protein
MPGGTETLTGPSGATPQQGRQVPCCAALDGTSGAVLRAGVYRTQQRAAGLACRHYRDTAAMLEKAMARGEPEPLVIGGHDEAVGRLLASLPPGIRERFACSFAADARTLTAARARELAASLVARWAGQRAERLAEVLAMPPGD